MTDSRNAQLQFDSMDAQRNAITLIEMLLAIALIAIMILVAIPVILHHREESRRKLCIQNLARIAIANQQYEQVAKTFPIGFFWSLTPGKMAHESALASSHGPLVALLPYLNQTILYNSINFDVNIHSIQNTTVAGTSVHTFYCPSDSLISSPSIVSNKTLIGSDSVDGSHQVGRSSYAGMAGPWVVNTWKINGMGQGERSTFRDIQKSQLGLFQSSVSYGTDDITDGLAHTIAFGEHSLEQIPRKMQPDIYWWISGNHGDTVMSSIFPINSHNKNLPDGVAVISASSSHGRFANFAFVDGSVKSIRDTIPTLDYKRPTVELSGRGMTHIQGWITTEVEAETLGPDPFWDTVFKLRPSKSMGLYQALTTRSGGESPPGY